MRVLPMALVAASLLPLTGCTGGSEGDKGGPCDFQFGAGPVAQFHEDAACAPNPWPSDRLLVNGALVIPESRVSYALPKGENFDAARQYLQETADDIDADGWSTIAPIHVLLDDEPDLATVADGIDLYRFVGGTPQIDATEFDASWDEDLNALVLQQRTPFMEATTYGVVVRAQLTDTDGRPTARSREFQKYITGDEANANDVALYDLTSADSVALVFTFTTATNTAQMQSIRDLVFGAPAGTHSPAYESPSQFAGMVEGYHLSGSADFDSSIAGITAGSNLAAVVNGSFDSWDFRNSSSGIFEEAFVNGTNTPDVARLDFRMTIPEGPVPPGGWPVVIYGHGLGGQDTDVFYWGDKLAPYGFAVVGISALQHGYRGTVPEFFDWESLPKTREHFRQTNADHLQLLRMLIEGNDDGLAPFDQLDVTNVSYMGISLGGILGESFLALSPGANNQRGLIIVGGGHLSRELYAESVGAGYFYPFLQNRAQIDSGDPEFQLFMKGFEMLVQLGMDRADPVNFATHVVAPNTPYAGGTNKLVLQTISEGDTWVPNDANEALQRAYGIPTLSAATTSTNGVSGAFRFTLTDFPQVTAEEPHGWFTDLCEAQEMGFTWLESGGETFVDPRGVTCP